MCPALLVVDLASHLLRYSPRGGRGIRRGPTCQSEGNRMGARMCVQSSGGYMFRKLIIALIAAAALSITAFAAVAPPAVAPVTASAVPVTASAVASDLRGSRGERGYGEGGYGRRGYGGGGSGWFGVCGGGDRVRGSDSRGGGMGGVGGVGWVAGSGRVGVGAGVGGGGVGFLARVGTALMDGRGAQGCCWKPSELNIKRQGIDCCSLGPSASRKP